MVWENSSEKTDTRVWENATTDPNLGRSVLPRHQNPDPFSDLKF